MADIKQIIDDNIYQNGQQRITGVVLNSVLKAMVDDADDKDNLLTLRINAFGTLVASLFEDAVFTKDRSADVARLKAMFDDNTTAICGRAICGYAVLGNS